MKNYLLRHLSIFKVLTAISFLFLYASGEKFGMFVFMMLLLYPFLMADGAVDNILFSVKMNPLLNVLINFIFIAISYWAVIYVMRSGIKNINSKINNRFCILGILIYYIYVLKILSASLNGNFSLITITVFICVSVITLFALLIRLQKD